MKKGEIGILSVGTPIQRTGEAIPITVEMVEAAQGALARLYLHDEREDPEAFIDGQALSAVLKFARAQLAQQTALTPETEIAKRIAESILDGRPDEPPETGGSPRTHVSLGMARKLASAFLYQLAQQAAAPGMREDRRLKQYQSALEVIATFFSQEDKLATSALSENSLLDETTPDVGGSSSGRGDLEREHSPTTTSPAQLLRLLERSRNILGNMALEREGFFLGSRWAIDAEPLRADARNLLPDIEAALSSPFPVAGNKL